MNVINWQQHIDDYLKIKDQISIKGFCRDKGIKFGSFKYRLYSSKPMNRENSQPVFVPVTLVQKSLNKDGEQGNPHDLRLRMGTEMDLYIPHNFDESFVRRLIRVIHDH